jgi:hypothetical protein
MIQSRFMKLAIGFLEERKRNSERDAATAADEQELDRRAYVAGARIRCREIRELRYCAPCHLTVQPFQSFCEHCTQATEPLPSVYALEYARAEFPDLVETRDDFDRLVS